MVGVTPGIPVEYGGPGPDVPEWMLRASGPVHVAAGKVRGLGEAVGGAGDRLAGLLVDTATALGWRGDAAAGASARAEQAGGQIQRLQQELGLVADALTRLGRAMDEHGTGIGSLARRRLVLVEQVTAAVDPRAGGGGAAAGSQGPRAELAAVDRQIQVYVDELAAVDRATTAVLSDVAQLLRVLSSVELEGGWVATATDPQVVELLSRYGVAETAQEQWLAEAAMFLPSGAEGDRQLRAMLTRLSPDQLAAFLERHPDLARRLGGDAMPPVGTLPPGPEAGLAAVLAAYHDLPPEQRVAAIRAYFASLTPGQSRRLALLHPGVVGNLNGAPLPDRMVANRVQIAVALDDELAKRAAIDAGVARMGGLQQWWASANDAARGYVANFDDPTDALASNQHRIEYYNTLLYEQVDNPVQRPGVPPKAGHQILYFDPRGDGKIAEMWGPIDPGTRHVAVFVPGTTVNMDTFGDYSYKMSRLAKDDSTGGTTTVTWLGMDTPDAIIANAPDPSYAEAGGPALRDFMWGLDVPGTADSTVIGHSYGGATVGVADRVGLETDRVLMIESAGAGRDVFSLGDYHEAQTGRHIDHYTMTAPGDIIWLSQNVPAPMQDATGIGHGGNPQTMPGFTVLETGYFDDNGTTHGKRIEGVSSHTEVLTSGSTAWKNMSDVIRGRITPDPIPQPPVPVSATPAPSPHPPTSGTTIPSPSPQPQPRPTGTP